MCHSIWRRFDRVFVQKATRVKMHRVGGSWEEPNQILRHVLTSVGQVSTKYLQYPSAPFMALVTKHITVGSG